MRMGRAAEAENDLSSAMRVAPQEPIVYSLRGSARLAQGRTQEAIADHRQALRLAPDEPRTLADLGLSLYFANQLPEALASFEKAQSLDPSMRHLDAWRCVIMLQTGKAADVKKLADAAAAKDAMNRSWVDALVVYLGGNSSDDELLKSVNPADPLGSEAQLCEAHFYIGMNKKLKGDNAGAQEHFQKALDTQANRLSAYRGAQFALKKFDAAAKTF
jgi:tetratricopeptide (TPR) repeat protein